MLRSFTLLLAAIILAPQLVLAQTAPSTEPAAAFKSMKDSIKPAKKATGFAMDGQFVWCSSVIKVRDTYHMFASRWPAEYGMGGWTKYSECVRATSKDLLGPYKFEEVVLQKREGMWDNDRVHNVKVVKAGEKFVLYYISSANETGYAEADAITGPWKRSDKVAMNFSNPAPLIRDDGSVYVFGRKKTNGIDIAYDAHGSGPPLVALDMTAYIATPTTKMTKLQTSRTSGMVPPAFHIAGCRNRLPGQ